MKIIPAIDIINGQCVRLSEGDFSTSKVYYADPLEAARSFEAAGLEFLHLVDLDGARQRKVANWDVLERITSNTGLAVDFSGGISSFEDVRRAMDTGAKQVAIGSLAVREPDLVSRWLESFGPDNIVIGADVRDGKIATHGWQQVSERTMEEYILQYVGAGGHYFLCTDISRDGKLQGPATALYEEILEAVPGIHLIASGGVSSMDDLVNLRAAGCGSAIVGKAIYENKVTLEELKAFQAAIN